MVYCAGLLYGLDGRVPWAGPWLSYVAWIGALVGVVVHFAMRRSAARVVDAAELVLRYGLALLLLQFASNKLIPGQSGGRSAVCSAAAELASQDSAVWCRCWT